MRRFPWVTMFAALAVPVAASAAFSDVPATHPYADAIAWLQDERIVQGYSDGTFRPEAGINRAEFVKIVMPMLVSQGEIDGCLTNIVTLFSDTPREAWFTPYACAAFREGVVSGYPDSSFRPGNLISYAEAAKILAGAFDVAELPSDDPRVALYFKGLNEAGSWDERDNVYWWQRYIESLRAVGALPPTYGRPEQPLTRGEMAVMIHALAAPKVQPPAASSVRRASSKASSVRSSKQSAPRKLSSQGASVMLSSSRLSSLRASSAASSAVASSAPTTGPIDLSVSLTGSTRLPEGSRRVHYEATLTNHGPARMAAPLFIQIMNSGNMVFEEDDSDTSCVEGDGGDVFCAIHALNPGQSETAFLRYQAYPHDCDDSIHVVAILEDPPANDTNALNNESASLTTESGCSPYSGF